MNNFPNSFINPFASFNLFLSSSGSGINEHDYQSPMMQEQTSNTRGFALDPSIPMSSSSYGYPSTLIENLFDDDDQLPLENQPMDFSSTTGYCTNLNKLSRTLAELPPLHLTNNTDFWSTSTSLPSDSSASIFPSSQAPIVEIPNFLNLKTKVNISYFLFLDS